MKGPTETGIFVIDYKGSKFVCLDIATEDESLSLDPEAWSVLATALMTELAERKFFDALEKDFGIDICRKKALCSSSGILILDWSS